MVVGLRDQIAETVPAAEARLGADEANDPVAPILCASTTTTNEALARGAVQCVPTA